MPVASCSSGSLSWIGAVFPFAVDLLAVKLLNPVRLANCYPLAEPCHHVVGNPFGDVRFWGLVSGICDYRCGFSIVQ